MQEQYLQAMGIQAWVMRGGAHESNLDYVCYALHDPAQGHCAWLLAEVEGEKAQTLLTNMAAAMALNLQSLEQHTRPIELDALVSSKCMIILGEQLAASCLDSEQRLTRQQIHRKQGHSILVTYSLTELLEQPQKKAQAWQDLCVALSLLNT